MDSRLFFKYILKAKQFVFLTVLLPLSLSLLGQSSGVCGFDYRKEITIQGSQITGGPHTDFPILINHMDATNLTTAAGRVTSANGFDIVFSDDNGNLLDFQLESYNGTTGQIVAWVKIPTLTNGTDVDINMLYGKATIVTDQSTTDTWDANFASVWHMSEDPSGTAPQIIDHTSGTNDGTANGSMTSADLVTGFCGNGIDFDGSNDFINIGDVIIDGTSAITVEAWINPSSIPTKTNPTGHNLNEGAIVHKNGATDDNLGITVATGATAFYVDDGSDNTLRGTAPPISTWTHVAVTWNGATMTIYQNGVSDGTRGSVNGSFVNNNNQLRIGGGHVPGGSPHEFDGIIDEVRISNVARSANWIATSRASQNNPEGVFYTITGEMNNVYTSSQNGDWDLSTTWGGSGVPVVVANVIINHRVDIDAGSNDYTICNCTLSNSTGNLSDLDMDDGRVLTIIEDFTLTNTSTTEIDLTLDDNGTTINVFGDMIATNSATNNARDVEIDLDDASVLSILGDLSLIATAGDNVELDLSETGSVTVGGNLLIDQDGGDDMQVFVDTDASIDIAGNVFIDQDGGDDILVDINDNVNGSAAIRITGDLTIDHDGGDDIRFIVDDAGSLLQVGGDFDVDWNSTNADILSFNLDGGDFTVAGTSTLARKNNAHQILFDMDGGDFTTGSLTLDNSGTNNANHSFFINVDQSSVFTVNGNLTINQLGGNNIQIQVNDDAGTDATMDINGDLIVDQDGGEDVLLSSSGTNSVFDISGSLLVDHDGGDDFDILTDGINASFNVGTTATIQLDGGTDSRCRMNLDAGTMSVGGAFVASRSNDTGPIFFDMDGGDFNANAGMVFSSSGALGNDGAIIVNVDDNSVFTCTGNLTNTMTGGDDFRIAVNNNAGTGGQFNCTGNLNVTRSSGDDIEFFVDDDNSLIDIGGDLSITTTGGEQVLFDLDNDGTINIDGNMSITATEGQTGLIVMRNTGVPSLDVGGDFSLTIAGGNDDYTIDLDGGEMTVGQDMTLTESTGANQLFLDMDGGDLSVTRDFFGNLSGASTSGELIMDIDNGTIMTVGRNMEIDISGGNDVELHLEQNVTAGTAQLNIVGNLTLDHNGATGGDDIQFIINNDATVMVGGDLTMDTDGSGSAGNFYTRLNNTSLLDVDGDIVMNSVASGLLEIELNNNSKLEIAGSFVRQVSPNNFGILDMNANSTVEYNGSATQIFAEDAGAGTDAFDYENVIINNSFGTDPQLTMEGLATVGGDITFTDGIIVSTTTNLLVLEDGSDALSESDASFVDGPVKKIGNDAFDFPVGDDSQLQQISITAPGSVADEFTAQYFEENPRLTFDPNSLDPSLDHISGCEYWTLDRTVGSSNVQVTLNYDANSCGVTDLTSLVVARWDGTTWRDDLGTVTGSLVSGSVQTSGAVSSFIASNPFTLASTNSANPLPIELLSFNARLNENKEVDLYWSTASEINNDFFTIQKSLNGINWEDVLMVDGAGNSSSTLNYVERDIAPYLGLSYYRLSQTDFDGTTTYFNLVPINLSADGSIGIVIYPNPALENETIFIDIPDLIGSEAEISIYDLTGKKVFTEEISLDQEKKLLQLNLDGKIPTGIYVVTVNSQNILYRQKLMIK